MSRLEPSPSTLVNAADADVGPDRLAADVDTLRPSSVGFALPTSIAPHLSLWRLIAEGSSLVFEGFDHRMAARVAVKVLAVRDDANAHTRLLREAALYANLDHPSVPRLYDVGALADGTPYVVMEFVPGHTLAELLREGALAPSMACEIASQILGALAVLHRAGIVHRDIKPTNIILEPAEEGPRRARLVDFGVAKASAFNMAPDKLTQPGALLGTPQYMAPEQFGGSDADGRSDLYAVGLILCEMLTGACPHAASSFADLVAARMRDELDEPALARAGIGPGLTRFLRNALARDPQARFASAEDMQCELHAARADESCLWMQRAPRRVSEQPGEHAKPVGPVATLPPAPLTAPHSPIDSAVWGVLPDPPAYRDVRAQPTRSGVKALLLGFGLTLGVGGVLVFRAQTRDAAESAAAASAVSEATTRDAYPPTGTDTTAAPLAPPASAAGLSGPLSSQAAPRTDQALGSGSLAAGMAPPDKRFTASGVAAELSRAAAERSSSSQPATRRRTSRARSAARSAGSHSPEPSSVEPSALPDNPY